MEEVAGLGHKKLPSLAFRVSIAGGLDFQDLIAGKQFSRMVVSGFTSVNSTNALLCIAGGKARLCRTLPDRIG